MVHVYNGFSNCNSYRGKSIASHEFTGGLRNNLSKTIKGAFPPSSIDTAFIVVAACCRITF